MQFAIPAIANSSTETQRANNYPNIRLFSVGQGSSSKTPLTKLNTIQETWSVASNTTVNNGNGFGIFSAVCWIFGRELFDGLGGAVPIGLVSSNWGGTPVERACACASFRERSYNTIDANTLTSSPHLFHPSPIHPPPPHIQIGLIPLHLPGATVQILTLLCITL
jgi:hypothetical protein